MIFAEHLLFHGDRGGGGFDVLEVAAEKALSFFGIAERVGVVGVAFVFMVAVGLAATSSTSSSDLDLVSD